ncbi:unnamed protein product [Effrenium voratum]|nr:unnamed protein product [Effrenium voratum]
MAEEDLCTSFVISACALEREAREADQKNDARAAIAKYEGSQALLQQAIDSLPHADRPRWVQRRQEILTRIQHLKSGAPTALVERVPSPTLLESQFRKAPRVQARLWSFRHGGADSLHEEAALRDESAQEVAVPCGGSAPKRRLNGKSKRARKKALAAKEAEAEREQERLQVPRVPGAESRLNDGIRSLEDVQMMVDQLGTNPVPIQLPIGKDNNDAIKRLEKRVLQQLDAWAFVRIGARLERLVEVGSSVPEVALHLLAKCHVSLPDGRSEMPESRSATDQRLQLGELLAQKTQALRDQSGVRVAVDGTHM